MPAYPGNKKDYGQTKNNSGKFKAGEPRFLVMHYTAGGNGKSSADYLFNAHSPASSAHFVVDRNGDVYQLSDIGYVTWHAGKSFWRGLSFLNSHSIGIEIANYGFWRPNITPATQDAALKAGWVKAKHKNGGGELLWEPYPENQLIAVMNLSKWILQQVKSIREIVGHDDIAPGRKSDPGPAFPMRRFQDLLNPRSEGSVIPKEVKSEVEVITPASATFSVNATSLNVRGGPGTNFDTFTSLKKGVKVTVLNDKGEWSYIEWTVGKTVKQGWVFDQYLTPT